jgi:hypothetical protein
MDNPDTLKILKETQAELRKAEQAMQRKPSLETFDLVRFLKSKVAQYSDRADARKAQS